MTKRSDKVSGVQARGQQSRIGGGNSERFTPTTLNRAQRREAARRKPKASR